MKNDNKKSNRKKRNSQDTLAVLAVLAIIILIGVICALVQNNNIEIGTIVKTGVVRNKEKEASREAGRLIIICVTAISIIILGMYIRAKILKKRRLENEKREKEDKIKEFLAAKDRVEKARMESFLKAGKSEIDRKKMNNTKWMDNNDDEEGLPGQNEIFEGRRCYTMAEMEKELEMEELRERRSRRYDVLEEDGYEEEKQYAEKKHMSILSRILSAIKMIPVKIKNRR